MNEMVFWDEIKNIVKKQFQKDFVLGLKTK